MEPPPFVFCALTIAKQTVADYQPDLEICQPAVAAPSGAGRIVLFQLFFKKTLDEIIFLVYYVTSSLDYTYIREV